MNEVFAKCKKTNKIDLKAGLFEACRGMSNIFVDSTSMSLALRGCDFYSLSYCLSYCSSCVTEISCLKKDLTFKSFDCCEKINAIITPFSHFGHLRV